MSSVGAMHVSPVLFKGALAGCWVVGAWSAWTLVVLFDRDLKPMILAMMMAGAMERPVGWTEMAYVNMFIVFQITCWLPVYFFQVACWPLWKVLCAWLGKCLARCSCCCRCCRRRADPDVIPEEPEQPFVRMKSTANSYQNLKREESDKLKTNLIVRMAPFWVQSKLAPDLRRPWTDTSAGKRVIPRILGLTTVLFMLFLGIVETIEVIQASMGQFYSPAEVAGRTKATDDLIRFSEPVILALQGGNNTNQREEFRHMAHFSSHLADLARSVITHHREVVANVLSVGGTIALQLVMFLLYAFMWLLQPMTSQMQLYKIVNTYFKLKTYCSVVYATATYFVLMACQVELRMPIALLSFFLNFIPEVGAIVSLFLPLPIILFDGTNKPPTAQVELCNSTVNLQYPDRYEHCLINCRIGYRLGRILIVFICLFVVKLLVGNGLESYLMGSDKVLAGQKLDADGQAKKEVQEAEELHPVIVLSVVVLGGAVWGPVGMLVSVPLISVTRLVMNGFAEEGRDSSDSDDECKPAARSLLYSTASEPGGFGSNRGVRFGTTRRQVSD